MPVSVSPKVTGTPVTEAPASSRRTSKRAVVTRMALLDAARAVFTEAGYAEASIADVVTRSRASVGSLYYHFGGGKADLYLALFELVNAEQMERATAAVTAARTAGEQDPIGLFLAGSRAYLRSCWVDRDVARLFLDGGGPDGFDAVARRRTREWVRQNTVLLRADERRNGEALVHTLTTVAGTAGREVAHCPNAAKAAQLTEDFLELMARIATPRDS